MYYITIRIVNISCAKQRVPFTLAISSLQRSEEIARVKGTLFFFTVHILNSMHALILEYNIHLVVGNRGMYNGVNTVYANEIFS